MSSRWPAIRWVGAMEATSQLSTAAPAMDVTMAHTGEILERLETTDSDVYDAPTLAGVLGGFTYTEGDAATVIASGITVADPDNTTLSSATSVHPSGRTGAEITGIGPSPRPGRSCRTR